MASQKRSISCDESVCTRPSSVSLSLTEPVCVRECGGAPRAVGLARPRPSRTASLMLPVAICGLLTRWLSTRWLLCASTTRPELVDRRRCGLQGSRLAPPM